MEAQLFQALLEDVFAGHGCVVLLVIDVACGIGEVNADVNYGDESDGGSKVYHIMEAGSL